ncbi:UDP-glucose 6-dehydrogenase TuaD [compost metagenome]
MKAGMGDGGPCHPRDNIALRDLSQRLDLGYDLFGEIIHSREQQAKNLAKYLASFGDEIGILGVGFKPGTHLTDGSYSLLVAHYLEQQKVKVSFYDPIAGHLDDCASADVLLLAHPIEHWKDNFKFKPGTKIVDPWRSANILDCEVIEYGNTRNKC